MSTWTSLIIGAILGVVFDICIKGIWQIIIRKKKLKIIIILIYQGIGMQHGKLQSIISSF